MNEKKSGVRTDLDPSEFADKMCKGVNKRSRFKDFFSNFSYIISALGLFPMISTGTKVKKGHGHSNVTHYSSSDFKQNYRVENKPQPRTHEQWLVDEMAHEAYHKMVDGKGDHDCNYEH